MPTRTSFTQPHLSPAALAARWFVTVPHLANERSAGRGPAYLKPAGRVCYPLAVVEAYEAASMVKAVA